VLYYLHLAFLKKNGTHFRRETRLGLAAPDHTVPYGTVLSRDPFPGTSCLATTNLSLWDERTKYILRAEGLMNRMLVFAFFSRWLFTVLDFVLIAWDEIN
jgi:hypothetical protein